MKALTTISTGGRSMGIIWTIIIGFVVGIIAKFLMPGKNEPSGFILTTILGIVGAFVASFLGQAVGYYQPGQYAGFISSEIVRWRKIVQAAGVKVD